MIRDHFPFAALVLTALPLAAGDGALAIVAATGLMAAVPLLYGRDVDSIVDATVARLDQH
jgi:hypothetical protein